MATTPTLRAKLDAGAWTTGAITATYSQTVSMSLASTAGYNGIRWEIYGFPPSWPCPAGWLEDPDNRIYYAVTDGSSPDPWDLPAAGTWGKWLLAAYPTGDTSARDIATAIEIVSPNGLHATPAKEGAQFSNAYESWAKWLEDNWRTIDAGLAGGTPAILAANEAALTAADDGTLANGTRAYVASHRSAWHLQTGDTASNVSHERIAGFTDGRVWQRELVRSVFYEQQAEWWVDPAAGDDQATGTDSSHPIKTLRELCRRVAPDGVWRVGRAITVNLLNDYTGHTLDGITFLTGTGAATVTFLGWEADPTVNTQFTVDSATAHDAATNQRLSVTMTAALTWDQGDIVRAESVNGGDAYHVVGYVDGVITERCELTSGTDSLGGDTTDPEATDTLRKVALAPLTMTGIRVIGGAPIYVALCSVTALDETARDRRIEGVVFRACQISSAMLGTGCAATQCAFKFTNQIASHDATDGTEGTPGFFYKCGIVGPVNVLHGCLATIGSCYLRSFFTLERKASLYCIDINACNVASNGAPVNLTGDDHVLDCSAAYSFYGSGHHLVTVGPSVTRGQIRLLTDGTSWGFAGSAGYDLRYDGSGDAWDQWYPWPSTTAGNYPACADLNTQANWLASPFSGAFARNRYSDLIIISTDPVS